MLKNLCKGVANQEQDRHLLRVKLKLTYFKAFPIFKLLWREIILLGKVFPLKNGLLDL